MPNGNFCIVLNAVGHQVNTATTQSILGPSNSIVNCAMVPGGFAKPVLTNAFIYAMRYKWVATTG